MFSPLLAGRRRRLCALVGVHHFRVGLPQAQNRAGRVLNDAEDTSEDDHVYEPVT
jgi:hypothetical protein